MADSATSAVRIVKVAMRYASGGGVGPITVSVPGSTILGVAGGNGAGKTTLLRLICGLIAPQEGTISVGAAPVRPGHPPAGLGAMIEEPAFYGFATGRQNLEVAAAGRAAWLSRVESCLELVGLSVDDQPVKEYSQGMRQRLGLARSLLGQPSLLVLDEPANGLDPSSARWLRQLLRSLRDAGTTIIVSSHMLGDLGRTVDSAIVLHAGGVIAEVDATAIRADPMAIEAAYFGGSL